MPVVDQLQLKVFSQITGRSSLFVHQQALTHEMNRQ